MATNNTVNDSSAPFTVSSGDLTITSGNFKLPTTSSTVGQIQINSIPFFHAYGSTTAAQMNLFVGESCGNYTNSGALNNIGIGYNALLSLTSGDNNVSIGLNAGKAITTASNNIFIGLEAGLKITANDTNICIGAYAGNNFVTGNNNIYIGNSAVSDGASTKSGNIAIGYYAGRRLTDGTITCVGTGALSALTTGLNCVALGNNAGNAITTANYVTAIGDNALLVATTPTNSTAVGYDALKAVGTGTNNQAFGYEAGSSLTLTDSNNIIIGNIGTAGDNNKIRIGTYGTGAGQQNLAYIAGVVHASNGLITDAGNITSAGNLLLPTTSSTVGQIQINSTPVLHTYGTANTFVGEGCGNLTFNTSYGTNNTGLGYGALNSLTSSSANLGARNTAIGYNSLNALTDGYRNTALGWSAGNSITTGHHNTYCGAYSGYNSISTGSYNTFIGEDNGTSYTTSDSSNILIGYNIPGTAGHNHELIIGSATGTGDGELSKSWIRGIRGVTTDVNDAIAVLIDSTGQLGTTSSSRKLKENICDMGDDSSSIYNLRPVSFTWKDRQDSCRAYGLIAEEVACSFPYLAVLNNEGNAETVKYHEISVLLLNEIQKLHKRIKILEARLIAGEKNEQI